MDKHWAERCEAIENICALHPEVLVCFKCWGEIGVSHFSTHNKAQCTKHLCGFRIRLFVTIIYLWMYSDLTFMLGDNFSWWLCWWCWLVWVSAINNRVWGPGAGAATARAETRTAAGPPFVGRISYLRIVSRILFKVLLFMIIGQVWIKTDELLASS